MSAPQFIRYIYVLLLLSLCATICGCGGGGGGGGTAAQTGTLVDAASLQPGAVKQTWQFGIYGSYIGGAGLIATDLDGDGVQEIVASALTEGLNSNAFCYVVRKSAAGGYEQVWRSDNFGVPLARILLADLNGDGKKDLVAALTDGTIHCYDGPTLKEFAGMQIAPSLKDVAIADVDGDGDQEVVSTDGSAVRVYSVKTGGLKWTNSACGGSSLAVGNVDGVAGHEIVTTGYGGRGYVIDGRTGAAKWDYANGFGARVRLADLDGDGKQEIVGASAWYKITIFDAALKSPVWEIATTLDIGAVEVVDTDGDGLPEIVYGDNQWGKLHAIDAQTHSERWAIDNPSHGVSGMAFGDVDRDGNNELLWGAGGNTTGADFLYIADAGTGAVEWQNRDLRGLSALAVGRFTGTGTDQLLMVTATSDSGGGVTHVFDPRSHALSYQASLGLSDWMGDHRALKIGDLDGDGRSEFVLSTSNTYDGFIRVYDGATRSVRGSTAGYDGNYFSALALGDVDGDGKMEIVAGQGRAHTGAAGVYLIVFDGVTLQEKWRSVDLGPYWGSVYDIKLADLDLDGRQDIICSVAGSEIVVFDGVTHVQKALIPTGARALAVSDVDGDGFAEILVGRGDGNIDVYDGRSFVLKKTVYTFSNSAVDALLVADLDGDGSRKWVVASGGVLTILQGKTLYWRSGLLGNNLGKGNNLEVKDTDNDGHPDIFVGNDTTLYHFQYLGASGAL